MTPPPEKLSSKRFALEKEASTCVRQSASQFLSYGLIGVANTAIHAIVFLSLVSSGLAQSAGNLIAFAVAVTFSFFANAKFTFKQQPTLSKFFKMTGVMAVLSWFSGLAGDELQCPPVITFIAWSVGSYIAGFIISRFFVFSK